MHNLDELISRWKSGLNLQENILADDIDELEDHLRMGISHLVSLGLSEEEAFLIAARRIGTGANLEAEFEKVNTGSLWIHRLRWMVIGILGFQALSTVWAFLARAGSSWLLMSTKSILSSGILFVVLSILLPVILWLGVKDLARKETSGIVRLSPFSQFVEKRWGWLLGCLAGLFLLVPIGGFLLTSITASNMPISMYAEYSTVVSIYQLVSGILLPLLGVILLQWLNVDRKKHLATN